MRIRTTIKNIVLFSIIELTSCDPVHTLRLTNQTNHPILVQTEKEGIYDTLAADSSLIIGTCIAHYTPRLNDVNIDYLKIVSNTDTVLLTDKAAIVSKLEKVDRLDWRIIYEDK